jgi:hypothetical protein
MCTYGIPCFILKEGNLQQDLVQTILPKINEEGKIILEPETILATRIKKVINQEIIEYLVKWKNLLVEEGTWEYDFFMLIPRFQYPQ